MSYFGCTIRCINKDVSCAEPWTAASAPRNGPPRQNNSHGQGTPLTTHLVFRYRTLKWRKARFNGSFVQSAIAILNRLSHWLIHRHSCLYVSLFLCMFVFCGMNRLCNQIILWGNKSTSIYPSVCLSVWYLYLQCVYALLQWTLPVDVRPAVEKRFSGSHWYL